MGVLVRGSGSADAVKGGEGDSEGECLGDRDGDLGGTVGRVGLELKLELIPGTGGTGRDDSSALTVLR